MCAPHMNHDSFSGTGNGLAMAEHYLINERPIGGRTVSSWKSVWRYVNMEPVSILSTKGLPRINQCEPRIFHSLTIIHVFVNHLHHPTSTPTNSAYFLQHLINQPAADTPWSLLLNKIRLSSLPINNDLHVRMFNLHPILNAVLSLNFNILPCFLLVTSHWNGTTVESSAKDNSKVLRPDKTHSNNKNVIS